MNFEGGLSQLDNLTELGVNPAVQAQKGKHIQNKCSHPAYYQLNGQSLRVFNIRKGSIPIFEVFYRMNWSMYLTLGIYYVPSHCLEGIKGLPRGLHEQNARNMCTNLHSPDPFLSFYYGIFLRYFLSSYCGTVPFQKTLSYLRLRKFSRHRATSWITISGYSCVIS